MSGKSPTKLEVMSRPDGNGSFRPRVVSALGRFGLGRFGLGRFGPGSFRPSLVGRFGLFFSTIRLVTEVQLNTFLASWRVHGPW